MKRLVRNLRDNSIEAFVLALETVNRPSVRYRTEAFCFLFCNAWELLLKAKLLKDGEKISYPKKRKKPRRSLSLPDCLNRIFTAADDPVKLNIQTIHDLRDHATHLVIPFVPPGIMGLFQAGVLNYPRALKDWFGVHLSDKVPLGMMALVYDFDPAEHSPESPRIRRLLPADTVRWLVDFQKGIEAQAAAVESNRERFYVPVRLQLVITKNPGKADIVLSGGSDGQEAVIVTVAKDADLTHPFRQKEVVQLVNEALGWERLVNRYDIQCVVQVHGIEGRGDFFHQGKFSAKQYSRAFVDWVVKKAGRDGSFFSLTRNKAKGLRRSARPR